MDDIKTVKWLSLKQAIDTLTRADEKVFLANVGPIALKAAKQSVRDKSSKLRGRGPHSRSAVGWRRGEIEKFEEYLGAL
jgi:8-oxo-dGTP diphosphatase